jgi:hypothetical protein
VAHVQAVLIVLVVILEVTNINILATLDLLQQVAKHVIKTVIRIAATVLIILATAQHAIKIVIVALANLAAHAVIGQGGQHGQKSQVAVLRHQVAQVAQHKSNVK